MSEDSVISRYCIDTTPWFLVLVMSDGEVGERFLATPCDINGKFDGGGPNVPNRLIINKAN